MNRVDSMRNDAVQQLRMLQAERDRRKKNSEELNDNLR
jgi:chromosome segregation ATPase